MAPPEAQRLDYPLGPQSIVLDVGAYVGEFTRAAAERWNCNIYAFEPCPIFFKQACTFVDPKVSFFCYGLGASTRRAMLSLSNDSSSLFGSASGVEVDIRDVADVWRDFSLENIDLMKMNCEGSEYELLERMHSAGLLQRVKYFQIQWHYVLPEAKARRLQSIEALQQTHHLQWDWPAVAWQSWERK
jgi:FkbM family methyltransferase